MSIGTVSGAGYLSPEELERRTQSGGIHGQAPEDLSRALACPVDIVSEHQDYTLREMADVLVERGFGRLLKDNQGFSVKPLFH